MKIALLGFDRQGRSAYDYWNTEENQITICDKNDAIEIPEGASAQLGDSYLDNLERFDLLVRTPGLHPQKIADANQSSPNILDKVTTVTNEFLRVCPTKNVIGVTGTKGKGTTSTLIANMLQAAGKNVHLGGNIGLSPLEMLQGAGFLDEPKKPIEADDWVVLELANYQLIDIKQSPRIAICLMITPEHLDWHESLDEYLRAKQQLFLYQDEGSIAIYKADDNRSRHIATSSLGQHIPYMERPGAYVQNDTIMIDDTVICSTSDIQLIGEHNHENICAAVTCVWQITNDAAAIQKAIQNTKKLLYRLEPVATLRDVTFYNDSFGTTPESAIVAIRAMQHPTVVILGGSDKGSNYDNLAQTIKNTSTVHHVILIGKMGKVIEESLKKIGFTSHEYVNGNMENIVHAAYKKSQTPGAILLSPACASFDMFKNYQERGDAFNQAVQALVQADQ